MSVRTWSGPQMWRNLSISPRSITCTSDAGPPCFFPCERAVILSGPPLGTNLSQRADVAVVGAGIVGLSAAYSLLERGVGVTVYERGVPGNGQSGGESRIFRHAHDDPRLVAMAQRSRAIWREWADRLGVELVSGDGVVALGPSAESRLRVMEQVGGVPARSIDAAELAERLPLLAGGYPGPAVLDEAGGSIRTGTAVEVLAGQVGTAGPPSCRGAGTAWPSGSRRGSSS